MKGIIKIVLKDPQLSLSEEDGCGLFKNVKGSIYEIWKYIKAITKG